MSNETHNALQNAAMIGGEWPLKAGASVHFRIEDIALAARIMATLEADAAFHWGEGRHNDWESACTEIASRIANRGHDNIGARELLAIVCDAIDIDCDEVIL